MIDLLFIGPLGWEEDVWEKVAIAFPNAQIRYISFTDKTIVELNKKMDFVSMIQNINKQTVIVAASFGTLILLKYLSENPIKNKVIFIEGFQELPSKEDIYSIFTNRQQSFKSKEEYLDTMLDSDEKKDSQLTKIVLSNLDINMRTTTSNKSYIKCLSIFSYESPDFLLDYIDTSNMFAFNSFNLSKISTKLIAEEDHLLMLNKPELIIETIKECD